MSDIMYPIPFDRLMTRILTEQQQGHVFNVNRPYVPKGNKLSLFTEQLETPIGPAAGPHTQLCQNIIAAYCAGSRFFELKTVQIMDGAELSACVNKPCITAEDECYNCEWSTELTVPDAFNEYVKAWYALKLLTRAFGWGDPEGFIFNMSVGYSLEGIRSQKIDSFIEGMKDASASEIFKACRSWAEANLDRLPGVDAEYLDSISPKVCTSVTVSTLHGCPPQEIESIASYLLREKGLNTFVKCNPTLLGYDFARKTLDGLGFDYIVFDEHHFNEDLQWRDAVPMFRRLMALSEELGLSFGLKLSNTFPVDVTRGELPSEEMYMSGRSLYPLTSEMASRIAKEFDGKLRISFSGGADFYNIEKLFDAGIWPITMATTMLKPGGYQRLSQIADKLYAAGYAPFEGVSVEKVARLAEEARKDHRGTKAIKPAPKRKSDDKVPLTNCFTAPCRSGCPIHQDIPAYIEQVGIGNYAAALRIILEKNPLPFMTGTICSHRCMDRCTRNFCEESVRIRDVKLAAAVNGFDTVIKELKPAPSEEGLKAAVVGGGPAGMAAAFFLARSGAAVTLFEERATLGGVVRHVIPDFRIGAEAIEKDVAILKTMGVKIRAGKKAPKVKDLLAMGYTHVILAVGAWKKTAFKVEGGEAMNGLDFLEAIKKGTLQTLGKNVVIVGGGNTSMDTARAAKRQPGVEHVRLVYRRSRRYMPADEEELQLALEDGVEFCELRAPKALNSGKLTLEIMTLGDADASGRRSPVPTGETEEIPCDTLIAAVGEKVDDAFLKLNGIDTDDRGRALTDSMLQTNLDGVYVIGDGRRGPATVVEAIADARVAADAILCSFEAEAIDALAGRQESLAKQGYLKEFTCAEKETERCLNCPAVCECCVQVCPNRANTEILVPGMDMPQILHVDDMCNECGNCTAFCPYSSSPYKEKLTLFSCEKHLKDSENPGFAPLGDMRVLLRIKGAPKVVDLNDQNLKIDKDLEKIIRTVLTDYSYLF